MSDSVSICVDDRGESVDTRHWTHECHTSWSRCGIPGQSCQQPLKEMKSPSGLGRVGVKGSKGKDCAVSKPAVLAALKFTKGVSAVKAWSIEVQHSVLS